MQEYNEYRAAEVAKELYEMSHQELFEMVKYLAYSTALADRQERGLDEDQDTYDGFMCAWCEATTLLESLFEHVRTEAKKGYRPRMPPPLC